MLLLHAKQIRKNAVAHELKLNSMASICLSCRGYGSVYFDIQLSVQTSTSSTRCILSVYIDKQWHNKSLHKVVKGVVQHACVQVMTHSACILASCLCFVTSFCLAPSAGAYGWHVQSCCSQLRNPKSAVSFASSLQPDYEQANSSRTQCFQPQPDNRTHGCSYTGCSGGGKTCPALS